MTKRVALFACQECGRNFYTTKSAERASNDGCPGCGGVDIDIFVDQMGKVGRCVHGVYLGARCGQCKPGYFGEEKDPLAPGECVHGNPVGGPCGECDGHGRAVPLVGDRVKVKGTPLVLNVDRTDGMYADLRFDDGLIFGKVLLQHLVLVEG
jgi:hypothetical protein